MDDVSDTPSDEPPGADALRELRALPNRYRQAVANQRQAQAGDNADDVAPTAVEEAAQARDLLDTTARRVERLLEDSKPVSNPLEGQPPRRGKYGWDPEVVLEVLDTNAERLARLVEAIPETTADRTGVRQGLESITGEIVNEAVSESERGLRQVERSVDEDG
jgi:hypothetical protein